MRGYLERLNLQWGAGKREQYTLFRNQAIAIVALGVTLAGVIFTATHRLRQDIKDLRGEIGELRERTQTAITQGWASMFPFFTPNLS